MPEYRKDPGKLCNKTLCKVSYYKNYYYNMKLNYKIKCHFHTFSMTLCMQRDKMVFTQTLPHKAVVLILGDPTSEETCEKIFCPTRVVLLHLMEKSQGYY